MKAIIAVAIVLMLLATPALANSTYQYNLSHDIELHLDGDFNFNSSVTTPSQGSVDIGLEGVGEAYLKSNLEIVEISQVSSNWFDLF